MAEKLDLDSIEFALAGKGERFLSRETAYALITRIRELESDKRDAERYRAVRAWFMREGLRAEIAPNGHIQGTTAAIVDTGVDAMSREQSGEA